MLAAEHELDEFLLEVARIIATRLTEGNDFQDDLDRLAPALAEIATRFRNDKLIADSRGFFGVWIGNFLLQNPNIMGSLKDVRGRAETWFDEVVSQLDAAPGDSAGGISDTSIDGTAVESTRALARESAASPSRPPEPCNSLSTRTEEVAEPAKGLFRRSQTVERPVTEVAQTHFHGWLVWEQKLTSRTYTRPYSVEELSLEIWLTPEGELVLAEISSGGAYIEGQGKFPYRRVENPRPATDEDLVQSGHAWQELDRGATPAIMQNTAWVPDPNTGDPSLPELMSALRSLGR